MHNVLEIKGLSKHYPDFSLSNLNLSLPAGVIMGLIGENGAGKTTTIKAILNLIRRDSGEIAVFGKDNIACEKEIKSQVSVVLDEGFFYEGVQPSQVAQIMKKIVRDFDEAKFFEYLHRFNLPDKQLKELSRGMSVKLKLATALARPARLLILDEPTSGLDPIIRAEILDILREFVQDEEKSILISSHITSDLEQIADYVAFIHQGRLLFCEDKDELLKKYGLLRCDEKELAGLDANLIVGCRRNEFCLEALVNDREKIKAAQPQLTVDSASLDEIMLYHVRRDK